MTLFHLSLVSEITLPHFGAANAAWPQPQYAVIDVNGAAPMPKWDLCEGSTGRAQGSKPLFLFTPPPV